MHIKPALGVLHQHSVLAMLKAHQGWLSVMPRDPSPSSCLSELEGSGSDTVQTPGTKLTLLHLVAGCSLSSWDLTTPVSGKCPHCHWCQANPPLGIIWASGARATYPRGFLLVICWHSVYWDRAGSCRAVPKACPSAVACTWVGILDREMSFHDISQQTWSKLHHLVLDIFHFRLKETSEEKCREGHRVIVSSREG